MALDRLENSTLHLLHRAGQCAGVLFQAEMARSQLTPRQFAILSTLAARAGSSQAHLVAQTGIDRSTLADIVRRMLKKGLIERQRTEQDARAYAVNLTEEGRKALSAAEPVAQRVNERLLAGLPERQRKRFLKSLSTVVEHFAEGSESAEPANKPAAEKA